MKSVNRVIKYLMSLLTPRRHCVVYSPPGTSTIPAPLILSSANEVLPNDFNLPGNIFLSINHSFLFYILRNNHIINLKKEKGTLSVIQPLGLLSLFKTGIYIKSKDASFKTKKIPYYFFNPPPPFIFVSL